MDEVTAPFILGRKEWVALPELGLPAIKAKIDTGARTSALHADVIEPFGPASEPSVRFVVHPIPERPHLEVACTALIRDRREVTSSSGETEFRFIIETIIRVGARDWPIELGLTNREGLLHRMLVGRQAIQPGMLVDPASSFLHRRLSPRLYGR
jgi:ribosomal protein S6--L-glutamate ligase